MRISYSADADVLYLTFIEQRTGAAYIEKENGDIYRVDSASGQLLAMTIQLFQYRLSKGETIDIPEVGPIPRNTVMTSFSESQLVKAL